MPLFQYEAICADGKKIHSFLDAESSQHAYQKLLQKKLVITKITPFQEKKRTLSLNGKERRFFTRDMARLLKAKLPLLEVLLALEERGSDSKVRKILLSLSESVRGGTSLSSSLKQFPNSFDFFYISMVANGEKTGELAAAFDELSFFLQKQQETKKRFLQVFLYPSFLLCFCFLVLFVLFFFVVPSIQELFEGRSLHPFTQIVFSISKTLVTFQQEFLALGVGILLLCVFSVAYLPARYWVKKRISSLPYLRPLFLKVAMAKFFRAVSVLLEGGVSILPALQEGKRMFQHSIFEEGIGQVEEALKAGGSISKAFAVHSRIPPLVPRMLSIAEQGGNLSFTMQQIAEVYDEELETQLERFQALAQPLLLIFLGVLVGFVLLSVLLPLTDVSSFVELDG